MAEIYEAVKNSKNNENESLASNAEVNSKKNNVGFSANPTLEQIRELISNFAKERNWEQYHQPRNLLLAMVGEVGELSELFQWKGEVKEGLPDWSEEEKEHLGQELSDVLLYLVRLSDKCHIDLPAAVVKKLALNVKKYPAAEAWGSSDKYTKYNSWVPRRNENMPKTIDQIHQEAEREAREQQINLQNMSSNYPKRMPDDMDGRKAAGRNINTSEGGWTSSSKSNTGSYSALDPQPDEIESNQLGPDGRELFRWRRGSSGGTKSAAEDVKTTVANRYSGLTLSEQGPSPNYDERRGSQSNQLPTASRNTSSTSKERGDLLETGKVFNRPTEPKAQETKKNDVHGNRKVADTDELCLRGPEYSKEEMEKKTKPLIDEFLYNKDFEEAIKCVTEVVSPSTVHLFINPAIIQVFERSSQDRHNLGQLLFSLLKKKLISFEQYKKGVGSVFEIIDDYVVDIPLIWDYMGEILEPIIEDSEFPLTFLKDVLQPRIPSEKAGLLVSAILHCSAKKRGTIKLREYWRESGLQWTDFLEAGADVNEFIQKHKLEFTVSPTKVKPNAQMTIDEIKKNLLSLLEKNEANETVCDWIDANVSGNGEPTFIRALVSAVHEDAISGSGFTCELAVTQLKERTALLTRYINHNEKLELQALYAIQALMNILGQPYGLLRQIFHILYDDDVITEETFKAWESSTDPNESEGKGVAVQSVESFFSWLRETELWEDREEADECLDVFYIL